ncbi:MULTISPECIES: amino acid permease [Vibrio]|jgi:serine transporter|uniref:HAAAP family serine/threonine permease n=1 Tax=Vibrio mediterranei TaxID=689 RepID=A0ABX5DH60_9VIBR|nr:MULTISPECIES: amino acid permease [Vibrio]KFA96761.1 membrane protein [Vibrio sp. ER1A]MCF4175490.1 amino acid permease [Vibrio sp. McD22-P3]MCG9626722.1 amino acid permease [Vibrio mediterranei]MCG9656627.1 amino acid permease [Vibrio mediterranei]MCG9665337.1 amino acid permease [Vibrio mediterranei]
MTQISDGIELREQETPYEKAGMSLQEWQKAIKFDSVDIGWIVMSIGMAIGAGIVFLPVQVGVMGLWVFLLSSVIGYPAMYLFQKLFINTLAESKECTDYPGVITGYLGKNWGMALGALYFIMLVIWVLVYSLAVTNDSASYLHSFGVTETKLSDNVFYGLALICVLSFIGSKGEKLLFKLSGFMAVTVLSLVALMGVLLVARWDFNNIPAVGNIGPMIKDAIITLPFTLTSILFIQSLSPMVISYRSHEKSIEVARYKATRAMKIAFAILFVIVFFFAVSFTFAISQDQAADAMNQNISALAIIAKYFPGSWATIAGIVINIFAVVTSFFGVFLAFKEACTGLAMNVILRKYDESQVDAKLISKLVTVFIILLAWGAIAINAPILSFTSICSPVFGLVGCLIPAYLVYQVPHLAKYKGMATNMIIVTGILLCISPFLAFL